MTTGITGIFTDSKQAGEAVAELKQKGYIDQISVISKKLDGEVSSQTIKDNTAEGAVSGAIVGTPIGALAGLLAGAVSVSVPGAVLLVAGPLAATWGLTGAAAGALSGGLMGGLANMGMGQDHAKHFEDSILRGDTIVAVTGDQDKLANIETILGRFGAIEVMYIPER